MPTKSRCQQGRRWSACHAACTGNVRLRVSASGAAAIGQRRVGVSMPTGSRCHLRFELVCISCNTITAVAACAARLAVAIPSRRVGAGNVRLRKEWDLHDISRQTFADSEAQAHRHFRHRLRANVGAMSSQHRTNGNHCDETVRRVGAGIVRLREEWGLAAAIPSPR